MKTKQLYGRLENVEFDDSFITVRVSKITVKQKTSKATMYTFTWPNGSPCLFIELYLQSHSFVIVENNPETSSLRAIASKLSHIARFCWAIEKDFWEIQQKDIEDFIHVLMEEISLHSPGEPRRDDNTVDAIVSETLSFIRWVQDNMFVNISLIGGMEDKANIRLKKKNTIDWRGYQKIIEKFPHLPPRATRHPKSPISREVKSKLWDAVSRLSDPIKKHRRYLCKFESENEALEELLYLKKRRELLLYLLEATGARPGELALLQVSQNEQCSKENNITLRTLKKRRFSERTIPIDPSVAIKLELFIATTRKRLLAKCGPKAAPQNLVFLTTTGYPLSVGSLTKEFSRIAMAAGLEEVQACMSMFRHRFITSMVVIHLKAFMSEHKGKLRATLNLADYRTILRRVAVFTGHSSEDSLLHYIDMAWDEMGLFDYVKPTFNAISKAEGLIQELSTIVSTEKISQQIQNGGVNSTDLLKTLENFLQEHKETFENLKSIRRDRQFPDGMDA